MRAHEITEFAAAATLLLLAGAAPALASGGGNELDAILLDEGVLRVTLHTNEFLSGQDKPFDEEIHVQPRRADGTPSDPYAWLALPPQKNAVETRTVDLHLPTNEWLDAESIVIEVWHVVYGLPVGRVDAVPETEIPYYVPPWEDNTMDGIFADPVEEVEERTEFRAEEPDGVSGGGTPVAPASQPEGRDGDSSNSDPGAIAPVEDRDGDRTTLESDGPNALIEEGVPDGGPDDDPFPFDCNNNGTADAAEILADPGLDMNFNGVLDRCEFSGDMNLDGSVDVTDLVQLILAWGACADETNCHGDLNGDARIDHEDLAVLMAHWG